METVPFKSEMRLACQLSIPIHTDGEAKAIYNELKIFLMIFSPDITLNGQVIMPLEPCCKDRKEQKPNVRNP